MRCILLFAALGACATTPKPPHVDANAKMELSASSTRDPVAGPVEVFTGEVTVTPLFTPNEFRKAGAGSVTFAPGARSNWHRHPKGQTLIITRGTGWVQQKGESKLEVKEGDVIWTPPEVIHWHGATATEAMSHIATQEPVEGIAVEWLEKVTDDEYAR
ncbi:MAG: (R)-mandelonitrile lyase [Archangium sp.]